MLLLLHIQNSPILESPLYDIRFRRSSLDVIGFLELGPKLMKVLELNEMPDLGEGGGDDGGFGDGGGGWDASCHC